MSNCHEHPGSIVIYYGKGIFLPMLTEMDMNLIKSSSTGYRKPEFIIHAI